MVAIHPVDQATVDAGQSFLFDFGAELIGNLAIGPGPEIETDQFDRTLTKPVADIVASDDEILPLIVFASDDDMAVGMTRIVMVDRNPVEAGAEIAFHRLDKPAGERLQILIASAVFRGDDEPELMAVTRASIQEFLTIEPLGRTIIKIAGISLAAHTVTLEVEKVRACGSSPLPSKPDNAGLHHHPSGGRNAVAVPRGEKPAGAGATPYSTAFEASASRAMGWTTARQIGGRTHPVGEFTNPPLASGADAAEAQLEIIIEDHRSLPSAITRRKDGMATLF